MMKRSSMYRLSLLLATGALLIGCGTDSPSSSPQEETAPKSYEQPLKRNPPPQTQPVPNQVQKLPKQGLTILHEAPTEGPEEVAWRFFKLQGEQRYEEALELLSGYIYGQYKDEPNQQYLREVIHSEFVRAADITSLAPHEGETRDAYTYRVIYVEVNFKLRNTLTPEQTQMRNGLNHYAVHLIQKKQGDPWKIVLLGGSPWLEE